MDTAVAADSVGVVTASLIFGAFILKVVDLVKYVVAGDWNGFLTLVLTWGVGVLAVLLFIETAWGDEAKLGDQTLDQLNFQAKLVFALAAPSIAAVLYDAKKAVDKTDTASTPRLLPDDEKERKARVDAALLGPASVETPPRSQ
jgi:hypothetical protein